MRQNRPDLFPGTAQFRSIKIRYREDNLLYLEFTIELPLKDMTNIQERIDLLSQEMSEAVKQPVKVNVKIVPFYWFESKS